jgi:decaprenyl-phosphate phosphoribosyltransferase
MAVAVTSATLGSPDVVEQHVPPSQSARSVGIGLVHLARPRQWIKNLLVAVAPLAGGVLTHGHDLLIVLGAFTTFCLAASGTYALNDVMDVEADRGHPTKQLRPVAAGAVPQGVAATAGLAWIGGSVAMAWFVAGWRFAGVVVGYVLITGLYSRWLKHEPIADLLCVSAGFVLRAIGGGVAVGVALSDWFLLVTSFAALLIVTGKRSGEQHEFDERSPVRKTLEVYPAGFLRSTRLLALSGTLLAYCLWAFERSAHLGHGRHPIWFELSVIPVLFALLRTELHFQRGGGAAPEELALRDRTLQIAGVIWVVMFVLGVYT